MAAGERQGEHQIMRNRSMETREREQLGGSGASPSPRRLRPLLGAWALLLALGAAAPARATTTISTDTTISTAQPAGDYLVTGTAVLTIAAGGAITGNVTASDSSTVNLLDGGSISNTALVALIANNSSTVSISGGSISGAVCVDVRGGTVSISGGSISGDDGVLVDGGTASSAGGTVAAGFYGVLVDGGTASISGGSISAGIYGVRVEGGTVNVSGGTISGRVGVFVEGGTVSISGGTISGTSFGFGVLVKGGTVSISGGSISGAVEATFILSRSATLTIFGCNLQLSGGSLTGTLQDGTPISTSATVVSPGQILLDNHCSPSDIAHLVTQFVTDPAVAQGLIDKLNAIAAAIAGGNANAKANIVGAFIDQVRAQTGKSITAANAATLIQLVSAL
jgi:hypothetical protein